MRRLAFAASLFALFVLTPAGARASDLGTSGPFRSLGGTGCPAGTPDACAPPPVDPALPRAQQVRRHVERALAFLDLSRVGDSRTALDEALRLDPDDLQALTLRGRLSLTNGKPEAARTDIEHAFRLAPGDPNLLATIAAFSSPDQAFQDLDAALAQKPDSIDVLFARARLYLRFGNTNAAFADLSRSLAIAPEDQRARLLRAQLQLRRQAYDLAIFDADKVLTTRAHSLEALQIKAAARLGAGDEIGAIETYTELLDDSGGIRFIAVPAFHDALVTRGRLYAKLHRLAEAKRDFDTLIGQQGVQALLQLQLYLRGHGYPNVEISDHHTTAFDTALNACFSDTVCGPNLFR
ncbi:MAG: hypothetical protein NVSMB26_13540 [Beijerinckiaceae bacterium]